MKEERPWYRRVYRWGQTNLTEIDPERFNIEWWREYWKKTRIQGVIINAGGIVFYYPTKFRETHRASYLGDRDLFGELVQAAREEGLSVLARMDSSRVDERFFIAHPDWIAQDKDGKPYRVNDFYLTCINSPYYFEFLPAVFEEVIVNYHPDGFTDNGWSGLERNNICYCPYCSKKFKEETGLDLPEKKDWEDPTYKKWITWSYDLRVRIWDLNNDVTRRKGGTNCLWVGMNSGDLLTQSQRFRDYKAICERSEIIMLDHQHRRNTPGFQSNGEVGKLIHGILGWNKLVPESTGLYQREPVVFRLTANPEPEVRLWALEGFAGTLQPWWHHIGAYHEDRRQYRTAPPLLRWHKKNEQYLVDRTPVATVGMVWTQRNNDFFGRDNAEVLTQLPWRGFSNALIRSRIPYLPVHADNISKDAGNLRVLILPNLGAISDAQCEAVRGFVEAGGGLVATAESSLYDEWGNRRNNFALSDLFGTRHLGKRLGSIEGAKGLSQYDWSVHSYLRIKKEGRGQRAILKGFENTDILPFGGSMIVVDAEQGSQTGLTFVPPFPAYPPELSWMRNNQSTLPALVLNEVKGRGRVAYLSADVDRCFARDFMPDLGTLLSNVVRWAARGDVPLQINGQGLIDCHCYKQDRRLILHFVNLTNSGTWRAPAYEYTPVGPLGVRFKLPGGRQVKSIKLLVKEKVLPVSQTSRWVGFEIDSITDHEVAVVETT